MLNHPVFDKLKSLTFYGSFFYEPICTGEPDAFQRLQQHLGLIFLLGPRVFGWRSGCLRFSIQQTNGVLAGVTADFAKLVQDRLFRGPIALSIALLDGLQIGSSFVFSYGGNPLDFGYTQCEATTRFY